MFNELVDFISKVTDGVNAMGVNLKTDLDGLQLEVAGNTINAKIKDGKVKSFNVDMGGNLVETIKRVADAFGKIDQNELDDGIDWLDGIPSAADMNPTTEIAIGQHGYPYLFGGNVIVGVLITDADSDKYNGLYKEHWTQFSPDDVLFEVVRNLIGAKTLTELFNQKTDAGVAITNINTDWCKVRIVNHYPEVWNRAAFGFEMSTTYPVIQDIVNQLANETVMPSGIIVGADNEMYDYDIKKAYDPFLSEIRKGSGRFVSFDVRRTGSMRTINVRLRLAEAIARVVYQTQLAYLTNTYECGLIEGYPNEPTVRSQYDRQFADMDYDKKFQLVKLGLVTWDKE